MGGTRDAPHSLPHLPHAPMRARPPSPSPPTPRAPFVFSERVRPGVLRVPAGDCGAGGSLFEQRRVEGAPGSGRLCVVVQRCVGLAFEWGPAHVLLCSCVCTPALHAQAPLTLTRSRCHLPHNFTRSGLGQPRLSLWARWSAPIVNCLPSFPCAYSIWWCPGWCSWCRLQKRGAERNNPPHLEPHPPPGPCAELRGARKCG